LSSSDWSGLEQGKDGYPKKDSNGNHYIAGGINENFLAQSIEIYGFTI
jgi:hypothetical protein